jgi:sugar lactone lactonase YvrE
MALNAAPSGVSQVVTFNPVLGELPESIAIDKRGNLYVSFFATGEIRQIASDGTQSTLAILAGPFPRRLSGLAVDASGDVYTLLNDIPARRGVWQISRNGSVSLFAPIPSAIGVNALAFDKRGSLFVSAPLNASIYRVEADGSVTVWVTNPLLQGITPTTCGTAFPAGPLGANGIAFNNKGDLFVLNTTQGQVVRISVLPDGSPDAPEIFVGPTCNLVGMDGQAFDNFGNLYVAVNIQNKIVRIDATGNMTTIATAPADPLFFPSAIAFETGLGQRKQIFITNFAAMGGTPGVVTMDVGVPGRPLP